MQIHLDVSFVPGRTLQQLWPADVERGCFSGSNAMFFIPPGNCQVKAEHTEMDFRLYLSGCVTFFLTLPAHSYPEGTVPSPRVQRAF